MNTTFQTKDLPAHLVEVLPGNTSPSQVLDHLACDVRHVGQLADAIFDTTGNVRLEAEGASFSHAQVSGLIWILRDLCTSLEWKIDQIERHYTLTLKENTGKPEQR